MTHEFEVGACVESVLQHYLWSHIINRLPYEVAIACVLRLPSKFFTVWYAVR